jgi:ABC-2 type transport system ATP-binding protein
VTGRLDQPAIECRALTRVYVSRGRRDARDTYALNGLDLSVPHGSVFGLLGPNGSGKTTAIRILATLLTPTSGTATVLGHDVRRQANEVRRHIGLVLGGERGLYWNLTGRENLRYFAALNSMRGADARRRIDSLLDTVGLSQSADTRVEEYSRGMKQRLHIARGLLTDPAVLLLDEPTTGLDPIGALQLRDLIPDLARQGKTIFLTTHYMLEADLLCERICLIDKGSAVVTGTPTEIKQRFSKTRIVEVTTRELSPPLDDLRRISGVTRVECRMDGPLQKITLHVRKGARIHYDLVECLGEETIESMTERDPNLEEAYVSILGPTETETSPTTTSI